MKDVSEQKGFKGLSSLSATKAASSAVEPDPIEQTIPHAPSHAADSTKKNTAPAPSSPVSQTKPSRSGGIITLLVVAGLIVALPIFAALTQPGSSQALSEDSAAEAAAAATEAQAAADAAASAAQDGVDAAVAATGGSPTTAVDFSAPTSVPWDGNSSSDDEQRPPISADQVLYGPQIRYCVREKMRLDGADPVVDASDSNAVSSFNAMVEDYNGRCGSFRYRAGSLEPIQQEAEAVRAQLEQEGRSRFARTIRSPSRVDESLEWTDADAPADSAEQAKQAAEEAADAADAALAAEAAQASASEEEAAADADAIPSYERDSSEHEF